MNLSLVRHLFYILPFLFTKINELKRKLLIASNNLLQDMYVSRINVTIWRNSEYRTLSRVERSAFSTPTPAVPRGEDRRQKKCRKKLTISLFIIPPAMSLPSYTSLDRPPCGRLRIFLVPFCKSSFSRAFFPVVLSGSGSI